VRLLCQRAPWSGRIEFLLTQRLESGGKAVVRGSGVVFQTVGEGEEADGPSFSLGEAEAQELMDRLWMCGLRPTEGTGSAGALAATRRHLDDMRRIVFEGDGEISPDAARRRSVPGHVTFYGRNVEDAVLKAGK
jgi:hypothetical protein